MSAKFGPAGNSDSFSAKYKSTADAPSYLKELGLDWYEYQCGRGVRVSDKTAQTVRSAAERNGIGLSIHAPYFISLSSVEEEKRENSIKYILQSCDAAMRMGADRIVIHSGSCSKISREEALELAKETLIKARNRLLNRALRLYTFVPKQWER